MIEFEDYKVKINALRPALEGLGAGLDQARARYDEAYKRLKTGNNNIARLGERMRKLGVQSKKSLPKSLTDSLDEEIA